MKPKQYIPIRNNSIEVRLSAEEKLRIVKTAEKFGLSTSTYVRLKLLI